MLVRVPDYYSDFSCVGTDCIDTCCKDWMIEIDDEAYERFKALEGDIGAQIRKNIVLNSENKPCIALNEEGYCSFLNEKKLCELYIKLGPGSQCSLCDNFPRIGDEYGNIRELSLSAACPRVADMILNHNGHIAFDEWEIDEKTDFDLSKSDAYMLLHDLRECAILLVENDELPSIPPKSLSSEGGSFGEKMSLLVVMAAQIQNAMDNNNLSEMEKLIYDFSDKKYINKLLNCIRSDLGSGNSLMEDVYQMLEKLDFSNVHFTDLIQETYKKKPVFDISDMNEYENMIVYMLLRYFMKAIFDGDIYSKIVFIIFSIMLINSMENGTKAPLYEIFYLYSREIEHCEENMAYLSDFFYEEWNNPQKIIKGIC